MKMILDTIDKLKCIRYGHVFILHRVKHPSGGIYLKQCVICGKRKA